MYLPNKWKKQKIKESKAGGRTLKILNGSPHIPVVTRNTNGSTFHIKDRDSPAALSGAFLKSQEDQKFTVMLGTREKRPVQAM